MRITRLKLTGFRRIALTGYTDIDIQFEKKIQLILGMNSSGKSSLLYELSPLPIATTDLLTNGKKEIWIEHAGVSYYLCNTKAGRCYFFNENTQEEMNTGGTQAVQKELVKQVFRYDSKIHDLLVGREVFTEMRPARRKEWITELSEVDYDYALRIFSLFKEEWRDRQGAYKLTANKLVEVSGTAAGGKVIEEQQEKIRRIETVLERLNQERRDYDESYVDVSVAYADLQSSATALLDIYRVHYPSLQVSDSLLGEYRGRKEALEAQRDTLLKDLEIKQDEYREAQAVGNQSTEAYQYDLQELDKQVETLRQSLPLKLEIAEPEQARLVLSSLSEELVNILTTLPSNEEGYYTRERLVTLKAEVATLQARKATLTDSLTRLEAEHRHLTEHLEKGMVTCPQCQYQHNPHMDSQGIQVLESQLQRVRTDLVDVDTRLEELVGNLSSLETYFEQYAQLGQIARNAPHLNSFWQYLAEGKYVSKAPRQVVGILRQLDKELETQVEIRKLYSEREGILSNLEGRRKLDLVSLESLRKHLDTQEERLGNLLGELETLSTELNKLQEALQWKEELLSRIESLNKGVQDFEKLAKDTLGHLQQQALLEYIRHFQSLLGEEVKILHSYQNVRNRIADLEHQLEVLKEEGRLYKELMTVISPTDGLIAKGLTSFIQNMVSLMNGLINKVWTYHMQLVSPTWGEGSNELDYRFPFIMRDDSNRIADIGLGSKGQQEMINLAFRVVACLYLGLEDIPIYADEFGTGLDETHRRKAAEVMKSITQERMYSQLFMISHYSDAHGALTNAEVCVLSEENITLPAEYNQHVRFS